MTSKSPFLVFQDFLSPKLCEQIVDQLGFYSPDTDSEGNPIKMVRHNDNAEEILFSKFDDLLPTILEYFGVEQRGIEPILFEYMSQGVTPDPLCDNSTYVRKKWARTKDRDFTAILFLSDFNDKPPFDSDYEVYGGKLEFPQHHFSFQPIRGTLVVYPSGPHFINANSTVLVGEAIQARIQIACTTPYIYNPKEFPGDYRTWFAEQ